MTPKHHSIKGISRLRGYFGRRESIDDPFLDFFRQQLRNGGFGVNGWEQRHQAGGAENDSTFPQDSTEFSEGAAQSFLRGIFGGRETLSHGTNRLSFEIAQEERVSIFDREGAERTVKVRRQFIPSPRRVRICWRVDS